MAAKSKALQSWRQLWHRGVRVQEVSPPHRKGYVIAVSGAGPRARITVALDGFPPAIFYPSQLTFA